MGTDGDDRLEAIFDRLIEAGLIEPVAASGLRLTDEFARRLDRRTASLEEADTDERLAALTEASGDADEAAALLELDRESDGLAAEYLVVSELDGLSHRGRILAVALVGSLGAPRPPNDGAPASFLPVDGHRLPFLVRAFERVIVYVWREDCPPCDLMQEDLAAVVDDGLEDVALFAVYGPDSMDVLAERYRVTGAPMTLFYLDGSVDARLRGANYQRVIRKEIEKLRARS